MVDEVSRRLAEGPIFDSMASPDGTSNAVATEISTSISTRSAAQKAFAVPELLEQILLHLEPIALFAVQGVSTSFKDIIASSPAIQQHMSLAVENRKMDFSAIEDILLHPQITKVIYPLVLRNIRDTTPVDQLLAPPRFFITFAVEDDFSRSIPVGRTPKGWVPKEGHACENDMASWKRI